LLLTSPVFSVFPENVFDIPEAYRSKFPGGLPSTPIIACLVALACRRLPEFRIGLLREPEELLTLAGLNDGGGGDGDDGGDGAEHDDDSEEDSHINHSSDESYMPSDDSQGSGTTGINGNTYSLGHPFDKGPKIHVMATRAVCLQIYSR
jgi:hypothetical protein